MTVSTTTSRVAYAGNGSTVTFSVPFYFLAAADLTVIKTTLAGVQTTLVLSTDYTVTGAGVPAGGSITCTVAPASTESLVIFRAPAETQLTDYQPNDPFPAETHERALDKLTMIAQRLKDLIARSFTLSDGDTSGASTQLPSPTANNVIGWNSTATGLQNVTPQTLATIVSSATTYADTFTGNGVQTSWTLTANPANQANLDVSVGGVTQLPGTDYTWTSGTTLTTTSAVPNGVKMLVRYAQALPQGSTDSAASTFQQSGTALTRTVQSKLRDTVSVLDFGAVGNNATDDTAAFQAALTAAAGKTLYVPKGAYRITSQLNVPNRTTIVGDGPISSQIYYRTSSTTLFNYLFNFDNVDNIQIEKIGLLCDIGGGCQNTVGIYCNGGAGSVTELDLSEVYIDGFQRYGILTQNGVYYFTMDRCRILNISNSVARGGTGTDNGIGLYFGATVNAMRVTRSRLSSNDVAIESATTNQKYSLVVSGCYFESNGLSGAPTEYDTISLKNWSAVEFTGNYLEANLTGTNTADSVLKLRACRGVTVAGNLFAGSFGGVGISKNLIGISDTCYGVTIQNNEFQDPITNYIYVADGNSVAQVYRNYYDNFGTPVVTYANIMAKMTANLVELDVPHIQAVTTGSISAGGNYQVNITIAGVPLDRNCTVTATLQGGSAADWTVTATVLANDTVRLHMDNIKGSPNSFTGNCVFRVFKNGSF